MWTGLELATQGTFGQICGGHLGAVVGSRLATVAGLAGTGWGLRVARRHRQVEREMLLEKRLYRETLSYLRLDLSGGTQTRQEFCRMVCRVVATRSSFNRAALLLRETGTALAVMGSAGMDDLTVEALNRWGSEMGPAGWGALEQARVGEHSFGLQIERRTRQRGDEPGQVQCARVSVIPLQVAAGLVGALVVPAVPRSSAQELFREDCLAEMMLPLEALALQITLRLEAWDVPAARREVHQASAPRMRARSGGGRRTGRRALDRSDAPALAAPGSLTLEQVARVSRQSQSDTPEERAVAGQRAMAGQRAVLGALSLPGMPTGPYLVGALRRPVLPKL